MNKAISLWRRSLAELLGTFAIVFFGCGAIILGEAGHVSASAIPVIFGLVVTVMIYTCGHISGAHFNPAVSLGFTVTRHFPLREMFAYWLSQLAGAFAGVLILSVLMPELGSAGATTPGVSVGAALLWEILLTFFLMLVIMSVATDTRAVGTMAGVAIGAMITVGAFVGGWASGASMNPVRSLAPAILIGNREHVWIYMLGPMIGAVCGSLTYKIVGRE